MGQAARIVGVSKATISRALASGRLSGTKLEDGSYAIQGVELARAFPPATVSEPSPWLDVKRSVTTLEPQVPILTPPVTPHEIEAAELRVRVEMLNAQLAREREALIREQETVSDLRTRLDAAQEHVARLALALPPPTVIVPSIEPVPPPLEASTTASSKLTRSSPTSPALRGGLLQWLLGR